MLAAAASRVHPQRASSSTAGPAHTGDIPPWKREPDSRDKELRGPPGNLELE